MSWLARHGVGPGTPDPRKVPSFLLLVGDPGAITFDFQAHLEVQYYVGRLAFDEIGDYQRYAEAVVEVEKTNLSTPRNVALLAPEVDRITRASNDMLVRELSSNLKARKPDWSIQHFGGELADKNHMVKILNGQNEASLVFAATHGLVLSSDDENQRLRQGALITNDWNVGTKPEETEIFAAADIKAGTRLLGTMYFLFGCFGAGTTAEDDYVKVLQGRSEVLTRTPFVAALPQRMLAAGAAGIIGHVGRAWGHSFTWEGAGPQPQTFLAVLESLLSGEPIGVAIHALSKRYAELAAAVASLESDPSRSSETSTQELLNLKTAMLDAKYFIVLGDPVVRLR